MPLKLLITATVLLFHLAGSNIVAQIRDISGSQAPTEAHSASELHSTNDNERDQKAFYAADQVQTLRLQISELNQQKMKAALPECIYVPAQLSWNGQTLKQVGVRFKGNSSANPNQKHKRSYLIKFSKYKKDQRFLGLERISLDNGVQFGSLFSEPIITDMLRKLGHATHRCNFAKLYVNEQFAGVYVNAERIDDSFIDHHFPGKAGGLWKNDTGGPGGDLRYVGDNPNSYSKAFEPKNKQAASKEEIVQLLKFIQDINELPDDKFEQLLSQELDIDNFMQTIAVMLLSGAFDQLTGWGPHNYYLYRVPTTATASSKWHYLPWDLDVGFCEIAFGKVYVIEDWNAAWPIPLGTRNPLLERLVQNPKLLARYRAIALDVLETHFKPQQLCNTVDAKFALIQDALTKDPFPKRRATVPTDQNYEDIVDSMKRFIRKRYDSAKKQLMNPGERPIPKQGTSDDGPHRAIMQRLEKSVRKAESLQRKLHEIQRTMQLIHRSLRQQNFIEAERLLKVMERLTEDESMNEQNR